ncbi:hypothetical protein QBK99_09995 [Corticibacterium sp. UT-5YL-CI-8]|nr:hypothetical protein [Tianweitania sp. UT-5YL-CI-8]
MRLTLDGLMSALRGKAHALADDVQTQRRRPRPKFWADGSSIWERSPTQRNLPESFDEFGDE